MDTFQLSTLLIEQERGWTAQCLEYDIAAQAESFSDIRHEICRVLVAHIALAKASNSEPFAGLGRAPSEYWDMFNSTKIRLEVESDDEIAIPHPSMTPELTMRIADKSHS